MSKLSDIVARQKAKKAERAEALLSPGERALAKASEAARLKKAEDTKAAFDALPTSGGSVDMEKGGPGSGPRPGSGGKKEGKGSVPPKAAALIARYEKSKGNFVDNLREHGVEDIMSAHGLTQGEAQAVHDHIHSKT